MIDNLFIVESPLQALVAVELSLQFEGQVNGIIYRLSGKGRERNDHQILQVIEHGSWSFQEPVKFSETGGLAWHFYCRKYVGELGKRFRNQVRSLFFGEFRSQWMHFARFAVNPHKTVLMDDGAATITVKHRYIDHGIYYPKDLWANTTVMKRAIKALIFFGLSEKVMAQQPLSIASAFIGSESEFNIDFSEIRKTFTKLTCSTSDPRPRAYFFGSKYSEAGILAKTYELEFISRIANYYQVKGLDLVYCAHRDESEEKLDVIRGMPGLTVERPELPAELFLLERDSCVTEIGAAYSSAINNLRLMFLDKPITSFRLNPDAVNPKNRSAIDSIYDYFEQVGIPIQEI